MNLLVSVVIPTFKRPALLKKCLEALLVQTLPASACEIIVVDDAGTESTRSMVRKYASSRKEPRIRYLSIVGKHGPAAARNRGWRVAQAPVVAFTDDDCIPEPDWLANGLAAFTEKTAGVSGRVIVPSGARPNDHEANSARIEQSLFVTANCFYRKSVLEEIKGFDERFTRAWREDADVFFTLLKRGERLRSAPDAIVVHPVRNGSWGASIREQSKSMFNALLYRKHPRLYELKIGSPLRACYYAIVASFFLALAGFGLGMQPLAFAGLLAWILCTGFLCAKRLRARTHAPGHVAEMIVTSVVIPFLSVFWRLAGALKFHVFYY